jgi:hypothetical protein
MAARKPRRGGRRPGAGRPVSTGSASTPEVRFRLGRDDYARAMRVAVDAGLGLGGVNELARLLMLDACTRRGRQRDDTGEAQSR